MNSQEVISPRVTKAGFRPIELDLSGGEFATAAQLRNKSIFRSYDDEIHSPHSVARANPIQDDDMREAEDCNERVISPYPYAPSPQELEERKHLMQGMNLRESCPFGEHREQESKSLNEKANYVDFSFYFENSRTEVDDVASEMDDVASDMDDVSFISYDEESLVESEGFRQELVSASMWETVLSPSTPRKPDETRQVLAARDSPAQVSVGSDNEQGRSPSPLALHK